MNPTPAGASGSLDINAKLFVFSGDPVHDNCGEIFSPLQVYFEGINSPFINAELVIFILV